MSWDEENSDRVEALLKLVNADLTDRVARSVLENMTQDEKRELKERVLKSVHERVDYIVNQTVESLVGGWVRAEAKNVAAEYWGATKTKIASLVEKKLVEYTTESRIEKHLEENTPAQIRDYVKEVVHNTLRSLKK
jgi:hypothetical protein